MSVSTSFSRAKVDDNGQEDRTERRLETKILPVNISSPLAAQKKRQPFRWCVATIAPAMRPRDQHHGQKHCKSDGQKCALHVVDLTIIRLHFAAKKGGSPQPNS